jgi:hypothetical protein
MKSQPNQNPAEALKSATIGMRLRWRWMARTRSVSEQLKESMVAQANTSEGYADQDSYAVSSKLFNHKMECFKAIAKLKGNIQRWWEALTLPYTEPGVRLLPRTSVQIASEHLTEFEATFNTLAQDIQAHRAEIIEEARQRLKAGFDLANYPQDFACLFAMEWSFVSVEPPAYLAKLCPKVFQEECQKAQNALQESVTLAQQAFVLQFKDLVDSLHERLTPSADGTKKVFRDSAVENLTQFFTRFQSLNITGQADLEALVLEAKSLIAGVEPSDLRNLETLRKDVQAGLGSIQEKLAPLVVNKARRKIITPHPHPGAHTPVTNVSEVPDAAVGVA